MLIFLIFNNALLGAIEVLMQRIRWNDHKVFGFFPLGDLGSDANKGCYLGGFGSEQMLRLRCAFFMRPQLLDLDLRSRVREIIVLTLANANTQPWQRNVLLEGESLEFTIIGFALRAEHFFECETTSGRAKARWFVFKAESGSVLKR